MRRKKKGEPESKNKRIKLAPVLRKTITEPDEGPALQGVRFSNHSTHKAPQITLDEERLTARGYKGYRQVRATHGVTEGNWYYELTVNTNEGHCRVGWGSAKAELQAPLGFDAHGYSIRDIEGTKFHKSIGYAFGESFGTGDVIGLYIHLPKEYTTSPISSTSVEESTKLESDTQDVKILVGSEIRFFKNGKDLGVAFQNIPQAKYYPAVSLYKDVQVTANFGPDFRYYPSNLSPLPISDLQEKSLSPQNTSDAQSIINPLQNATD